MGKRRGVYRVLVGKAEIKGPLGKPRRRWEDNIKMALQEIAWRGINWTKLAQNRDRRQPLINTIMNIWVPQNVRIP
jgi:hypothetical protein